MLRATPLHLFCPQSVAVIGASDDTNKVGGRPIYYMKKFGYMGEIFPVNPTREQVQGLRSFKSLQDIGVVPDAAIIAVSGSRALQAVEDCVRCGVTTAIVMSSGFAETGQDGRALQKALVDAAKRTGMRLIGPNAQGLANFSTNAIMNFSTMFMSVEPKDGPIAIVSQSGAASVMPYALLRENGLGVRYLAATGNDADLGVSELVATIAHDPEIRLILVYVETISHPELLAKAARIARAQGATIVLLKGGRSKKGAAAAASHTGAMIGNDGGLDAFLERNGIQKARDIRELINAAGLYANGLPPRKGRTAVVSHSGAVGILCADSAEDAELALSEFSSETQDALRALLPAFGTATNPLDLTAALMGNKQMFPQVLDIIGRSEEVDMLLVGLPVVGPGYDLNDLALSTARFASLYNKPAVVSASQPAVRAAFQAEGIPTFMTETDAVQALSQYAHQNKFVDYIIEPHVTPPESEAGYTGLLDEAGSLALLQEYGLPVVPFSVCASVDAAAEAAGRLGPAVAIKGCASSVPHKTDHQLVHLNLEDEPSVRAAADDCLEKLKRLGVSEPQVIVAKMVKGKHEFMLGVTIDPLFGPIITIGEGGTLVEVRRDIVSLLAPFTEEAVLASISKLRIAPVLAGVRTGRNLDARALAKAAVTLSRFAMDHKSTLKSADLNPVMVMPEGEGVVVVDALVEFSEIV